MDKLNQEQREALAAEGDVLVVACPGSGKTHTLIHKIAAELSQVTSHREFVVALTYTHIAAEEIRDRIEAMGVDISQLWVGTIHSFCFTWILRPYSIYHENLRDGFSVVDTFESEELLKEIAKRHPPLRSQYDCKYHATDRGFSPDRGIPSANIIAVQSSIAEYHERLLEQKKIDFEMMLKFAHDLIIEHRPIAKRLSKLFRVIAIDEYQDTRDIQYSIISRIIREKECKTKLFIVGDPNQAIFGSLGGVARTADEISALIGRPVKQLTLKNNYRSSQHIVDYFSHFAVNPLQIQATGQHRERHGDLVHDTTIDKSGLVQAISQLIRHNVEVLGIPPEQICIVAPWWIHLASITRSLVQALPEYDFNGPGLSPFAENRDNFWYKVARLALTDSAPDLFRQRIRWAREVLDELAKAGHVHDLSPRDFLKVTNGIQVRASRGTEYLAEYFDNLSRSFNLAIRPDSELSIQRQGFFDRTSNRIARIHKEESINVDDIETFRAVFRPRTGIVISTIHGVKGAEFDSVIAFGLLEGLVPHFGEPAHKKLDSAKKLMFVIGSRARLNLYLISETGRGRPGYPRYQSNVLRSLATYDYSSRSIVDPSLR
ncbi:UvrD-helicase domain-containing protein [Curtobacterium sp. S6]|uniref:UvrD-helicase domain-containing protein n=1 Tax=Curtobacterium sp. S6 TaxID=1479623 RepID=UPI0004AAF3C9|nr:ATP-dependent helicase [Curtobacterium sp. S6]